MRPTHLAAALVLGLGPVVAAAQTTDRAGQTSPPATQSSSPSKPLSTSEASAQMQSAEREALDRLHATDPYKEAKAKADSLESKLKEARLHGTPQEKLSASHDFITANQNLKNMETAEMAADPRVIEAHKLLDDAKMIERTNLDEAERAEFIERTKMAQRERILDRLEIGAVGRLAPKLVTERSDTWHESTNGNGLVEIVQVIDEQNSLVYAPTGDGLKQRSLVLLHGFPHNKVDGQIVYTGKTVFRITGRKQFGGRTVFQIEPVD